jgi:hypothetical protein
MRNNHHNPNKVPPFKPDPEHWTKKVHSWKAKVSYETEDDIGMEHGGEPSAYLIGWIASCINKARLGIGDFVEIKDKEE